VKKSAHSHHSTLNELNITPLLDLVFVLLVIFIITTPQMMNNLEMALPSAKPPPTKSPPPQISRITISDDGRVTLNDQLVQPAALKDELRRLKTQNPELSVVVKGADEVDYQHVVSVLDTLQQLDITKVGLATAWTQENPSGPSK
jgi:biopolymer transport protein ExbD